MADGYVVAQINEREGNQVYSVWNGTDFLDITDGSEVQNALFYPDLVTGRAVEGALQAQFPELEIELIDAVQGITMDGAYTPTPPPVPPAPEPPAP